ncbi:HAMP domain-containing sensor histidine kinase [uncultured Sulfitobacter sp.]|uniref:sensor histidine kinase n=1 Tax=uncultured Sulfitobacter sp. TaxID=191468 RepID=UPI0026184E6F|nr:HAMP domain-containing sensor histidine kinase [uncultured Sulfitobacter sp.]
MTRRPASLLRSLTGALILPGAIVVLLGVFIVYTLVREEYDELQDLALTSKANLLLNIWTTSAGGAVVPDYATLLDFELDTYEPDERTMFWFVDAAGGIVKQARGADPALFPERIAAGMATARHHRYAIVRGEDGRAVIVATPMIERNEAIRDVLAGVVVGFALLGLLFAGAAYRAVRRSVRVIADLSADIAARNEHDLSPIERGNSFAEFEPAIDTLDALMVRLDAVLAAERAFATNAAHELRTPIAICLAHVQRLKSKLPDPAMTRDAAEIELGLKRLVRLVERLLEMARAQSGLGRNAAETDMRPVIAMLLKELRARAPSPDRLVIAQPAAEWRSRADPDAIGIILNNLFDNALKYAAEGTPVIVDASRVGRVEISNDCAPLSAGALGQIKQRFTRHELGGDGFGLGLSIVQDLCDQSGCRLQIYSPRPKGTRGFMAVLTLPPHSGVLRE